MEIGTAKSYAITIEYAALEQIRAIEESEIGGAAAHIRIMPDAHAGKGCVIGTTMKVIDKVIPTVVGVDIGCGVTSAVFYKNAVDLNLLDRICREDIVSGMRVYAHARIDSPQYIVNKLRCLDKLDNKDYYNRSFATLGSGNHFIELGQAETSGAYFLTVHCGSRKLGRDVAVYYSALAAHGKGYLEGQDMQDYLHDMNLCQIWAADSRRTILNDILFELNVDNYAIVESIHNYIDMDNMILRKGAISAQDGEFCLIPLNMRDGTLLCRGKGNPEWNYSAPHGAGRLMSRGEARRSISLKDYKKSMEGIASSTVCKETIDEAPFAYKNYREIMEAIGDTVEIKDRILPIYNFKGV